MGEKSKSARDAEERQRSRSAREEAFEAQREQDIRNFEAAVLSSFSFLEEDYGFERRAAERRDFEYSLDANVVVPYYGPTVAVHVVFGPADSRLNVAIYELEDGRIPEQVSLYGHAGYARAINVDSFVSMVSGETVPPVLPEASPRKPRIGVCHAAELRREALRNENGRCRRADRGEGEDVVRSDAEGRHVRVFGGSGVPPAEVLAGIAQDLNFP